MHLQKIEIRNFRLLANVVLLLEQQTTVIVGRNNSGKTSLTELFRRLLAEPTPSFRLEDFSLSAHDDFWKAFRAQQDANPLTRRKGNTGTTPLLRQHNAGAVAGILVKTPLSPGGERRGFNESARFHGKQA